MAWSGSIGAGSAVGASQTLTSDTSGVGAYTVSAFTAPKKGVYRFQLKGSGGRDGVTMSWAYSSQSRYRDGSPGGAGGYTDGYLLLEAGQTVYLGVGGRCSAAFVASSSAGRLADVPKANLYLVAGGGADGGGINDRLNNTGWNCAHYSGGAGGGTSGGQGARSGSGASACTGGTQTAGGIGGGNRAGNGAYGVGGEPKHEDSNDLWSFGGRGGDGYYGGGGGYGWTNGGGTHAEGGAGGSGYVKTAKLTVMGKTYTSATQQGGGAGQNANGTIAVTYYAQAELPVIFNGAKLTEIVFNGTKIGSLIYNGARVFARRTGDLIRHGLRRATFPKGEGYGVGEATMLV